METPSTPHRGLPTHILESSPSFSAYFSDDEAAVLSPSPRDGTIYHQSPLQTRLLARLHGISLQILRKDVTDHTRVLLDLELDALEQTLQAPDPQSRQPADIDDSGLFVDDDGDTLEPEEDTQITEAPADKMGAQKGEVTFNKNEQFAEMQARLDEVAKALQCRYEEVQHINKIALTQLKSVKQQVAEKTRENCALREDLAHVNDRMLYLKLQVRALETESRQYIDSIAGRGLRESIERWKTEWREYDRNTHKCSSRQDSGLGLDAMDDESVSPDDSCSVKSSPKKHKITISRTSLPFPKYVDMLSDSGPLESSELAPSTEGLFDTNAVNLPSETSPNDTIEHVEMPGEVPEEQERQLDIKQPVAVLGKTAWEELWDGLTALTGMQQEY